MAHRRRRIKRDEGEHRLNAEEERSEQRDLQRQRRERQRQLREERRERLREAREQRRQRTRMAAKEIRKRSRQAQSVRRRKRPSLPPEEQALRDATRRANLKLSFYTHFITYVSVLMLILVASRSFRVVLIVAASWGVCIGIHYFSAMVAPELRRRLIEREIPRQVRAGVSRERRAIETRHVRSLEDLSASIAHEIRNPITAAKSLVQQMGEDPVSGENIEYAKVAIDELDRVERSISHLLRFSREEELRLQEFTLIDVVDSALETFRDPLAKAGIDVHREVDSPGQMRGDSEKCRKVVINLVGNAVDALVESETPNPRIDVMAGENLAGTEVWVRIWDNGPGIDEETLGKIFSPFYTTKEKGTGLGLALSKRVVDAHGGSLEAHSSPGEGTEFILSFPSTGAHGGGSNANGEATA